MTAQTGRHEFRVVIEGADLPREAIEHINRAVQQAATLAMASIDVGRLPDWHIHIPPWNWGIWYRPLSEGELQKAGIEVPRELFPEG